MMVPQQAGRPGNPTGKRPRITKKQREQIVKRIKGVRGNLGMTQADFGIAVGVGQAGPNLIDDDEARERSRRHSAERTVQSWENRGVVPRRETLVQIARLDGVSVDYLLTGEHKPESESGDDLESRLRVLEGRVDATVGERRAGGDLRGGYQQVARLILAAEERTGANLTELREAVATLASQLEALVLEVRKLQRASVAPEQSGTSSRSPRVPRAKGK